jgi:hypothetical protein
MNLNDKTLEQLRIIINGDDSPDKIDYRSGPKLVSFFNDLGFNDCYTQGFPSRWIYTDTKLKQINGTPELDNCLRKTFAVYNFIGRIEYLDSLISNFNKYIAFDKWQIVRENENIIFQKTDKVIIEKEEFLKKTFDINIDSLGLDSYISEIIKLRIKEVEICINNEAPLSAVILIGSIMEGILLGMAITYQRKFNQSSISPKEKDTNKVKKFYAWKLSEFIDVATDIGLLKQDVKKFSHFVRDFRNYIHPYEQISSKFTPDKQTALICFQVLKAAISQINSFRKLNT